MDHDNPDPTQTPTAATSRDAALAAVAELHAAIAHVAASVTPVLQALIATYGQLGKQLRDAGVIDEHGQPAKPADRPAWQSPYGPRTRRR